MAYEPGNPDYSQDRMSYSADHAHFEPKKTRSRDSSSVKSDGGMADHTQYLRPHQPINEAVTSAFDKADTSNYASPELIAQITAQITQNVIQQLKTTGIQDSGTPVPQNPRQFPPPPIQQPVPLSPSTMSGSSPPMHARGVYTPPSPQKHHEFHSQGSPHSQSAPFSNPPQSPVRDRAPHSYPDPRSFSPLSHSSEESRTRPKGPERLSTGKEETTLERIWGQLFDQDGHPTARLGQFLRGLAVHIIEDYEPRHSIVITPTKMAKFYEDVRLPNELYPWSSVFDDERSRISRMLRELSCQHHLVQETHDVRPEIPGLTPVGFERWSTLLIQAHPDEEFERLAKAALAMPINNPDEPKERFPKELSRRLFPGAPDHMIRQDLENAISEHANIDLPRRISHDESTLNPNLGDSGPSYPNQKPAVGVITPTPNNIERERKPYGGAHLDSAIDDTNPIPAPPHHRPSVAESTYTPNNIERERKPYSSIPSESAIDDTNPFPPPPPASTGPLERERKPYSSQPINGRNQDDLPPLGGPPKPRTESNASTLGRSESVAARPGRADSTARPRPIPPSNIARGPMETPKPEIHHHRQPSNAQRRRSHSFTRVRDDFRRSDGDIRGYQPTFQPGAIPNQDGLDEDGRRFARDRARRQGEEDARLYGESPGSRARFERPAVDMNGGPRGSYLPEEDYYRNGGRVPGNGYDYQQPYGGPAYR